MEPTEVCAHLGGSMERGHYVAFINVGPTLKVTAIGTVELSGSYGIFFFQSSVAYRSCYKEVAIVFFLSLVVLFDFGMLIMLIVWVQLKIWLNFWVDGVEKWWDLFKFVTLPLEKRIIFPLLLVRWFYGACLCQPVSETRFQSDRWHVFNISSGLNAFTYRLAGRLAWTVPIHWFDLVLKVVWQWTNKSETFGPSVFFFASTPPKTNVEPKNWRLVESVSFH